MNTSPCRWSLSRGFLLFGLLLLFIPLGGAVYFYYGDYQLTETQGLQARQLAQWMEHRILWRSREGRELEGLSLPALFSRQRMIVRLGEGVYDSGWETHGFYKLEPERPGIRAFYRFVQRGAAEGVLPTESEVAALFQAGLREGGSRSGLAGSVFYHYRPFFKDERLGEILVLVERAEILRYRRFLKGINLLLTLVSLLFALLLGGVVHLLFTLPLRRLAGEASRTQGRRPPPSYSGRNRGDEIGTLARSFERKVQELFEESKKGEIFTAEVLHEVKNPLAGIRSYAELLERAEKTEGGILLGSISLSSLAEGIIRETGRTEKLLAAIRDFVLWESEHDGINPAWTDLTALLGELASFYAHRGVLFHRPGIQAAVSVSGDPESLGRALRNLIDNGLDFSEEGRVSVSLSCSAGSVLIEVADDGPGISQEHGEKVFQRFYSTRRDSGGGHAGLGLFTARRIVEEMGGTLTYKNLSSGGTVFLVKLPLG